MRGFDFGVSSGKSVNLRGKSEQKSREQILQEARKEREARQRQRLQQVSAINIQKVWRGSRVRAQERAKLRREWTDAFANAGEGSYGCVSVNRGPSAAW